MKQLLNKFKDLTFEEGKHIYRINKKIIPSTSSFVAKFYKKFDAIKKSKQMTKSSGEAEELRAEWKKTNTDSIKRGNYIHNFLEHYVPFSTLPKEELLRNPAIEINKLEEKYTTIANEFRMYNEEIWYAGTADKIMVDDNGDLIIVDYKTNKDLWKNFRGRMLLEPFHYVRDNPYNHYVIQQNMYKDMLELAGFKVSKMIIKWFKQDGTIKTFELRDISNLLKKIFDNDN